MFGSLAFLYVFSFGRRLAGWSCGVVAVLMLYTFGDLIFTHGLRGNNMEAALSSPTRAGSITTSDGRKATRRAARARTPRAVGASTSSWGS